MPACRHCRSPARGNPCWWRNTLPVERRETTLTFDPPCEWDAEEEMDSAAIEWRAARRVSARISFAVVAAFALGLALALTLFA